VTNRVPSLIALIGRSSKRDRVRALIDTTEGRKRHGVFHMFFSRMHYQLIYILLLHFFRIVIRNSITGTANLIQMFKIVFVFTIYSRVQVK
jgi:hypothetical protein